MGENMWKATDWEQLHSTRWEKQYSLRHDNADVRPVSRTNLVKRMSICTPHCICELSRNKPSMPLWLLEQDFSLGPLKVPQKKNCSKIALFAVDSWIKRLLAYCILNDNDKDVKLVFLSWVLNIYMVMDRHVDLRMEAPRRLCCLRYWSLLQL